MQALFLILIYAKGVVLFSYALEDLLPFFDIFTFCRMSELVKQKPLHQCTFTKKEEMIQVVKSFKYLGIYVPSTNRWYYAESRP